jgi:hypothetical protein
VEAPPPDETPEMGWPAASQLLRKPGNYGDVELTIVKHGEVSIYH